MVGKNSGWIPVGLVFLFGCTGVDQMSVPPTPDPKPNLGQPPVAAPPANVVGGFSAQIPEFTLPDQRGNDITYRPDGEHGALILFHRSASW